MKFGKLVDLELQMKEHMIVDALDSVFEVFDESLETLESLQTAVDTMKNGDMDKKKLLFVLNHQNKLAEATNVALPESVTAMEGLSDIAVQYDSELIVSALEGFISNTIKAVVDAIGRFITIIRDFIVNLYHRIIGKKSQLDGIIKKTFDNVNEIDENILKPLKSPMVTTDNS